MEELLHLDITNASTAVLWLSITALILFLLPLVCLFVWKKHCGKSLSLRPLFFGAAGFLVFARVLELGVHMVCIVQDNAISRFINGNTIVYMLYGALMAGIFEECGRYVVIKYLMKKDRTREDMILYGIGHGGIEVWAITLLSLLSLLSIVLSLQRSGVADTLPFIGIQGEVSETQAALVTATLQSAVNFGAGSALLNILERVGAMAVHISLTIVVGYGVRNGKKQYLPLAVLAHALVDTFPALYQRGAVTMPLAEIWLFVCAAALVVWAAKLYWGMPAGISAQD